MTDELPSDDRAAERFATDLDRLVPAGSRLGIAVSGGPDSLALLQLAHAARPGIVEAVTVDHRLRGESAAEAARVAELCEKRGIPHETLVIDWPDGPPTSNIEAAAREKRYALIGEWANAKGLAFVATAHHADDQAETLAMRLARGAGLAGLAGIRRSRALTSDVTLVRPLLDWDKVSLIALVREAGWPLILDPMNKEERFDRVRVREALAEAGFGDAAAWSGSAQALAEAEEALQWTAERLADRRLRERDEGLELVRGTIPPELLRRLLLIAFDRLGDRPPRGPDLQRAIETLETGGQCTLGKTLLRADGDLWSLLPAPPRRH